MRIFSRIDDAPIDQRVRDLNEVLDLVGADLTPEKRREYESVATVATDRLRFDPDTTVVALIGATGSGKSSLFNALLTVDLAPVGVRRPTTTSALAASAPGEQAVKILDWLGIKDRVYMPAGLGLSENITIVDMPDIDSVNEANRELSKKLAARADVLVWVVDPQKYADDVLHSEFIQPYASHSRVMLVALTQVDLLSEHDARVIIDDLRRLLEADGLTNVRIVPTSSVTGEGVDELRMYVSDIAEVQRRESARLKADVADVAAGIRTELGASDSVLPGFAERDVVAKLTDASARAAGVHEVAKAVRRAYLHRSGKAITWLPFRGLRLLRADPLKRWHLGDGEGEPHSMRVSDVSSSALQVNLRAVTEGVSAGRPRVWSDSMRRVASAAGETIEGDLADAVASTELAIKDEASTWWKVSNALQWVGWIAAIVGAGWLAGVWLSREFLLLTWDLPKYQEIPYPTWLLLLGVVWTLLVAIISRLIARLVARRAARKSLAALNSSVEEVVRERLWAPLHAEDQRQRRALDVLSRL